MFSVKNKNYTLGLVFRSILKTYCILGNKSQHVHNSDITFAILNHFFKHLVSAKRKIIPSLGISGE